VSEQSSPRGSPPRPAGEAVGAPTSAKSLPPALAIAGLTVRYGRRTAVDALDLVVRPGELVGLLGPNGAGKSTTLLAVAGALMPSAGTIAVGGFDLARQPDEAKARIGLADQPPSLYEFLTVAEHLEFVCEARRGDTARVRPLLDELGLAAIGDRPCRELSFGMRQRVGLAAALLGPIELVLLDETLNGLDPHAARRAAGAVVAAAKAGAAVVMSTHLLDVAARLCTRIVVMDRGKIVAERAGEGGPLTASALEELYLGVIPDTGVDGERAAH
jgi:ABC-2 type transport system ATP-binding protein